MATHVPDIDNVELNRNICRQAIGGVTGQTTIIVSGNAREQRNVDWPIARSAWTILWVTRTSDPLFKELVSFFRARQQRAYGFRYFDWTDNDDWGHGHVELIDGVYRLTKWYVDSIRTIKKNIYKPIAGTVTLSGVTGSPVIDYTTGVVSGATSAGTWVGQFNLPVRFDTDKFEYTVTPDQNVVWNGVSIVELI